MILHVQRISISINSNDGDFASAGSRKIKNVMTLLLQGVRKTNVILHLQRISISINSNNGDFASAGNQADK